MKNSSYSTILESADGTLDNYVQETGVSYGSHQPNITLERFFEDKMLLISTIRKGLTYAVFQAFSKLVPFSEEDWAQQLDLSAKSLQRYKKEADFHFKSIHTEKIIEVAEVSVLGNQVFDSMEQFHVWLNTPSFALGSQKPSELLKDSYGKDLVMAELNRIEHGVFV